MILNHARLPVPTLPPIDFVRGEVHPVVQIWGLVNRVGLQGPVIISAALQACPHSPKRRRARMRRRTAIRRNLTCVTIQRRRKAKKCGGSRATGDGTPSRPISQSRLLLGVNPYALIVYHVSLFREREVSRNQSAGPAELSVSLGDEPHDGAMVNA